MSESPEDAPAAEEAPPPAPPKVPAWWERRPRSERGPEPWSHAARLAAYEVFVIVVTAIVATVFAFVGFQGQFLDLYTRFHQGAPVSEEVVLVTIGTEALYLWNADEPEPEVTPRGLLAEVVSFLDAAGAEVVVLDFLLDRPAPGDDALATAAQTHGGVVVAERYGLAEPGTRVEFVPGTVPVLEPVTLQGVANFQLESPTVFSGESVVRRVPLVREVTRAHLSGGFPGNLVGARMSDQEVVPSMALASAWLLRARQADPSVRFDSLLDALAQSCTGSPLRCDPSTSLGLDALGPLHKPLDINYRGSEQGDRLPTVRAAEMLRVMAEPALLRQVGIADAEVHMPDRYREALAGKLVVVGRVDGSDHLLSPYAFPMYLRPDMAGPRIQAQVIDTLLSGRHIRRVPSSIPTLLGLALAIGVVISARRLRDDAHIALWIAVSLGLGAGGLALFLVTDGVTIELGFPIGLTLAVALVMQFISWANFDTGVGQSGEDAA
ncbi:MAG: CHASE2 domain-containing protein [Proteobacteria bacterium]|nr:CHASE2 domain-containing protein [Pseudomonadota bacterium]